MRTAYVAGASRQTREFMVRVIQISDTHLSPGKQHFVPNWEPVAASLRAQQPDLVIHTGDLTVDAADQEADAAHCAALLRPQRSGHRLPVGHEVLLAGAEMRVGDLNDANHELSRLT